EDRRDVLLVASERRTGAPAELVGVRHAGLPEQCPYRSRCFPTLPRLVACLSSGLDDVSTGADDGRRPLSALVGHSRAPEASGFGTKPAPSSSREVTDGHAARYHPRARHPRLFVAGRLLVLPDRVVATLRGLLERRFDGPTPVVPFTLLPRTGLGERQRFVVGTGS